MDFFDVIKNRKSVREYSDRKIDKAIIEKIIDSGRVAATARNEQPWEFIATSDKEVMRKISSMCPNAPFIKDAPYLLAVFSKDTKYYLEDCSAATQNILLAIEALGLAGCWIAGDKKDYAETVGNILNAPRGYRLVSMISAGYPKKSQGPKTKRPLKEVLHWEKW